MKWTIVNRIVLVVIISSRLTPPVMLDDIATPVMNLSRVGL